jgi:hypothetical protein
MANSTLLTDDKGNPSSGRVMAFISLFAAIGFGAVACVKPMSESGTASNLALLFMTGGTVQKVGGKLAEKIG